MGARWNRYPHGLKSPAAIEHFYQKEFTVDEIFLAQICELHLDLGEGSVEKTCACSRRFVVDQQPCTTSIADR